MCKIDISTNTMFLPAGFDGEKMCGGIKEVLREKLWKILFVIESNVIVVTNSHHQ